MDTNSGRISIARDHLCDGIHYHRDCDFIKRHTARNKISNHQQLQLREMD